MVTNFTLPEYPNRDVYVIQNESKFNYEFNRNIEAAIFDRLTDEMPFTGKLEAAITISINEKRFSNFDIDNLIKATFDSLNG